MFGPETRKQLNVLSKGSKKDLGVALSHCYLNWRRKKSISVWKNLFTASTTFINEPNCNSYQEQGSRESCYNHNTENPNKTGTSKVGAIYKAQKGSKVFKIVKGGILWAF